jgi:uncharacterized protein
MVGLSSEGPDVAEFPGIYAPRRAKSTVSRRRRIVPIRPRALYDRAIVRCPICGAATAWRDNPQRPFCSSTCRLIDLGGWLDGRYRIPPRDEDEGATPPNVP